MDLRSELRALVALVEDDTRAQYQLLTGVFAVKPTLDEADLVLPHLILVPPYDVPPYSS